MNEKALPRVILLCCGLSPTRVDKSRGTGVAARENYSEKDLVSGLEVHSSRIVAIRRQTRR